MTRVTRRMLIWPALAVVLVVLFLVEERVRGTVALRAWERDMRARGERLTAAELTPPLPTDPSVRIVTASEAQSILGVARAPQNMPSGMYSVAPGKARVIWATPRWLDADGRSNSWAELRSTLDWMRDSVPELRAALTNRSFLINLDYSQGFNMLFPHLPNYKAAAQVLNADTMYALHEGRLDEADENLRAAASLVDLAKDEGLLISQLVRMAVSAISTSGLWQALQAEGWSEERLAAIQVRWEQQEFLLPLAHSLAMERAMGAMQYDQARHSLRELRGSMRLTQTLGGSPSDPPRSDVAELLGPVLEATKEARLYAGLALWRFAWAQQDQLFHHREIQRIIDRLRRTAKERRSDDTAEAGEEEPAWLGGAPFAGPGAGVYDNLRYRLAPLVLPALEKTGNKAVRAEVVRELGVAAIALKRYQLKHTRLPPSLEALVPEFARALPRDWYDGQPLRYRPNPDGTFLLYSVGANRVDDHGDSRNDTGDAKGMFNTTALDIVWPQRATPEEVAAAERDSKPGRPRSPR